MSGRAWLFVLVAGLIGGALVSALGFIAVILWMP